MKKIYAMIFILLVVLFSCVNNNDNTSSAESSMDNQASTDISTAESESSAESLIAEESDNESKYNELKAELELQLEINKKQSEYMEFIDTWYYDAIFRPDGENMGFVVKEDTFLTFKGNLYQQDVTITYPDGASTEIVNGFNFNHHNLRISPLGSKIILNSFESESSAITYLFDVDSKEKKLLELDDLPISHAPSFLDWLDDRYFLFVAQLDHGTVARGGDVYLYDTQTDDYAIVIDNAAEYQTNRFYVFEESLIVFRSELYEETFNFTETIYSSLTVEKIMELYENKETISLHK